MLSNIICLRLYITSSVHKYSTILYKSLTVENPSPSSSSSSPTTLDAVVYGGIEVVITCQQASGMLKRILKSGELTGNHWFPRLQQYCHASLLTQRKGLQFISSPSTANFLSLQS